MHIYLSTVDDEEQLVFELYPGVTIRLPDPLRSPVWVQWWQKLAQLSAPEREEHWARLPSPSPWVLDKGVVYLRPMDDLPYITCYDRQGDPYGHLHPETRLQVDLAMHEEDLRSLGEDLVRCQSSSNHCDDTLVNLSDLHHQSSLTNCVVSGRGQGIDLSLDTCEGEVSDVATCYADDHGPGDITATDGIYWKGLMSARLAAPVVLLVTMGGEKGQSLEVACDCLVLLDEKRVPDQVTILRDQTRVLFADREDAYAWWWKDGLLLPHSPELPLEVEGVYLDRSCTWTADQVLADRPRVVITRGEGWTLPGYQCRVEWPDGLAVWVQTARPKSARMTGSR